MAGYRKGRDPFSLPQENETDEIQQFIKYKYIEKKWYSENPKLTKKKKQHKQKNKKVSYIHMHCVWYIDKPLSIFSFDS